MKQKIQLIAVLFTVASAGLAMGSGCLSGGCCPSGGCSMEKARLEPVKERIIERGNLCASRQAVLINRTAYVPESPSCYWVPPSTSNPAYAIGNFVTAPFRLITGRSLGQPDVVDTYKYSEPVGEKITTLTTRSKLLCNDCGCKMKSTTTRCDSMLAPVGERITTVKVIRTKPLPASEQPPMACPPEMHTVLAPVGERTIIRTTRDCNQPSSCSSCF